MREMTALELSERGVRDGEYFILTPTKKVDRFRLFLHTHKGHDVRILASGDGDLIIHSTGCPE